MNNLLTIKEISQLLNITANTVYKNIRKKKLKGKKIIKDGKSILYVEKQELEKFLGHEINQDKPDNIQDNPKLTGIIQDNIQDNPEVKNLIKSTVEEIILNYPMMKPLEEQAIFIAGKLSSENQFLREKLDTVINDFEQFKDSVKALPDKAVIEAKDYKILSLEEENENLKKQMELLPAKPEKVTEILLQNAENIKFLQEELSSTAALVEKLKEQAQKEKEEALQAMSQAAEKEKLELVEAWKKKVDEVYDRPWWKFW